MLVALLVIMSATMPFDYDTSTNIAIVGVSADALSGTDMAITELARTALPIVSTGIRVRFADEFGNFSPTFDLAMAMELSSGNVLSTGRLAN